MTRIAVTVEQNGRTVRNAVTMKKGVPLERGFAVLQDWVKQQL